MWPFAESQFADFRSRSTVPLNPHKQRLLTAADVKSDLPKGSAGTAKGKAQAKAKTKARGKAKAKGTPKAKTTPDSGKRGRQA